MKNTIKEYRVRCKGDSRKGKVEDRARGPDFRPPIPSPRVPRHYVVFFPITVVVSLADSDFVTITSAKSIPHLHLKGRRFFELRTLIVVRDYFAFGLCVTLNLLPRPSLRFSIIKRMRADVLSQGENITACCPAIILFVREDHRARVLQTIIFRTTR